MKAMFVSIGMVLFGMALFFFVKEDLKRTKAEKKKSFVRESVAIKSRKNSKKSFNKKSYSEYSMDTVQKM